MPIVVHLADAELDEDISLIEDEEPLAPGPDDESER